MYASYMAQKDENWIETGSTREVFNRVAGEPYYKKVVYFYPSENDAKHTHWVWTIGHEKATPYKREINRIWNHRWVLHFCVAGKGFFNGSPVRAGDAFICWPGIFNSMVADPEDPFEFYWFMVRGDDTDSLARSYGFSHISLQFRCSYLEEAVALLEIGLSTDYSKVNIFEYNDALMNMLFLFQKATVTESEAEPTEKRQYIEYVRPATIIMSDYNYAVPVAKICSMLNVSMKHFCRAFRLYKGISPKQYMTKHRLQLGEELLKSGFSPVEVAEKLQYSSYALFYKAFEQMYGISPNEYLAQKGKNVAK